MSFDQRGFVNWLEGTSRTVFYEMVCNHASLRPESEDVQMAFKELCTGGE